jgi:hypothetical protein
MAIFADDTVAFALPLNLALPQNFKRKLTLLLIASIWMGSTVLSFLYQDASASLLDDLFGRTKGVDKTNSGAQEFKVYQNTSAGISTRYPSSWKANSTYDPEDPSLIVTFYGPKNELVELAIDPLSNSTVTLNQAADDAITYYQNSSKDFELLELNPDATLAGMPAYKMEYSSRDPDTNSIFKSMEVTTIIQNKEYTVAYIADPNSYYSSLPLVQKIIDSYKITK